MSFRTSPLRFPDDRDVWIERFLTPYAFKRAAEDDVSVSEFAVRLMRDSKWYGIMSAAGTGKRTLINTVTFQLAAQPNQPIVALPVVDLALYRGEANPDVVVNGLAQIIFAELKQRGQEVPPPRADLSRAFFADWLGETTARLRQGERPAKLLLCFDNFERLERQVQRAMPEQFKKLHDNYHERLRCLIATDIDLQKTGRDMSPLHGVLDLYTLVDFERVGEKEEIEERAHEMGLRIGRDAWDSIHTQTGGYPFWVGEVLGRLEDVDGQKRISPAEVDAAINDLLTARQEPRPIERFLSVLENWAEEQVPERLAIGALSQLFHGAVPIIGHETEFEALALKGIVRADVNGNMTWRNPIVEQFLRKHQHEIEMWAKSERRPGHKLQSRGRIHVTLVLNLSRFVSAPDKVRFDDLRATSEYAQAVEQLEERLTRNLSNKALFGAKPAEDAFRNIGIDLNLFTHEAAKSAFTPVYYLKNAPQNYLRSSTFAERMPGDTSIQIEAYEEMVRAEWSKWHEMSVQLTREGTAIVRLVRQVGIQDKPAKLFSVLEDVLGLENELAVEEEKEKLIEYVKNDDLSRVESQARHVRTLREARKYRQQVDRSVQWEIAMGLIEGLIVELFSQVAENSGKSYRQWQIGKHTLVLASGGERDTRAGTGGESEPIYPLHDRYVVFEFDKLCDCPDYENSLILAAKDFSDVERQREIAGLLEGVAIKNDHGLGFPSIKDSEARKQFRYDFASWQGELCLITVDNALVYYKVPERQEHNLSPENATDGCETCPSCHRHEKRTVKEIHFPRRGVAYTDYWQAVIRGMEYVIGLRLIAQLVAHRTANYLGDIADLSRRLGDNTNLSPELRSHVADLRSSIANSARLLAVVRSASIPLSIARSDYGARKFDSLLKQSGIPVAVHSAESNLRDLNAFLIHYDEIVMEHANRRTFESIEELTDKSQQGNIASITVTIFFATSVVASTVIQIWIDTDDRWVLTWRLVIAMAIIVAGATGLAAWQMRQVEERHKKRKQERETKGSTKDSY